MQRKRSIHPVSSFLWVRGVIWRLHKINYAQSAIDEFSNPLKLPQIAISVDMLDTGIDVPEVLNLVFFKKGYE